MRVILSRSAMADLERMRLFLADQNPAASRRAIVALVRAIDGLTVFPDRGRPTGNGNSRELSVPFGRSGYVIRFVHDPKIGDIIVTRIWHGREERPAN